MEYDFEKNAKTQRCRRENGFTLIELLVIVSIIGMLSTIVLTSIQGAKYKAFDARRVSDMEQIRLALDMYRSHNGAYPEESTSGGDISTSGIFLEALRTAGNFPSGTPVDPVNVGGRYYYYIKYDAGSFGCDAASGAFYVLGVKDMDASGNPHPHSPGWSCSGQDWQDDFEWVTGGFDY